MGGGDRDIDCNVVEAIGGERWMESHSNVGRTDVSGVVGEEIGWLKVYVVLCASPFGSGSKVLDEKESKEARWQVFHLDKESEHVDGRRHKHIDAFSPFWREKKTMVYFNAAALTRAE